MICCIKSEYSLCTQECTRGLASTLFLADLSIQMMVSGHGWDFGKDWSVFAVASLLMVWFLVEISVNSACVDAGARLMCVWKFDPHCYETEVKQRWCRAAFCPFWLHFPMASACFIQRMKRLWRCTSQAVKTKKLFSVRGLWVFLTWVECRPR